MAKRTESQVMSDVFTHTFLINLSKKRCQQNEQESCVVRVTRAFLPGAAVCSKDKAVMLFV